MLSLTDILLASMLLSAARASSEQIRLVGGRRSWEGRVEVFVNGTWSTVCHDYWGQTDAEVACRQLGLNPAYALSFREAHFGRGTGIIQLSRLRCKGSEARLTDCITWGHADQCHHGEDAGVSCHPGCSAGMFGADCQKACGFCKVGDTCHASTGVCPNGCTSTTKGQLCREGAVCHYPCRNECGTQGLTRGDKVNIAYAKKSAVSSAVAREYPACLANNGKTGTTPRPLGSVDSNCLKTAVDDYAAWYMVDLGRQYTITDMTITRSHTIYQHRPRDLSGMSVLVENATTKQICYTFPNNTRDNWPVLNAIPLRLDITCGSPLTGQKVWLQKHGDDRQDYFYQIVICELQVWACRVGMYGQDCEQSCSGNCKDATPCDNLYGTCPTGCSTGHYGADCAQQCGHCRDGVTCNETTGICPNGCRAGTTGTFCKQDCAAGRYGYDCRNQCGRCQAGETCQADTGVCPNGCEDGMIGPLCKIEHVCPVPCQSECGTEGLTPDEFNYHTVNIAYGQKARVSSSSIGGDNPACLAVNGRTSVYWRGLRQTNSNCIVTATSESAPWFWVELSRPYTITDISIHRGEYPRDMSGMSVLVENATTKQICYTFPNNTRDNWPVLDALPEKMDITCGSPLTGQKVWLQKHGDDRRYSGIYVCELQVWACRPGLYGRNCTQECSGYCKNGSTCDNYHGTCPAGCSSFRYGSKCGHQCGYCRDGVTCNSSTGVCPNGCAAGKNGPFCKTDCTAGRYGYDCEEECGHCKDGNTCNAETGACPAGCTAGMTGRLCKTGCSAGDYGYECREQCGQCRNDDTCNAETGECPKRCKDGWYGLLCKTVCWAGTYGFRCRHGCGQCRDGDTCNPETGECPNGCAAGMTGPLCNEGCSEGWHGFDCREECGRCRDEDPCNAETGVCPNGCAAPMTGPLCKQGQGKHL